MALVQENQLATDQRTGGAAPQPVFCIVCQASIALCAAFAVESSALVGGAERTIGPDGYPLRVDRRRVGLEVTELLLLEGTAPHYQPSLATRGSCGPCWAYPSC